MHQLQNMQFGEIAVPVAIAVGTAAAPIVGKALGNGIVHEAPKVEHAIASGASKAGHAIGNAFHKIHFVQLV